MKGAKGHHGTILEFKKFKQVQLQHVGPTYLQIESPSHICIHRMGNGIRRSPPPYQNLGTKSRNQPLR